MGLVIVFVTICIFLLRQIISLSSLFLPGLRAQAHASLQLACGSSGAARLFAVRPRADCYSARDANDADQWRARRWPRADGDRRQGTVVGSRTDEEAIGSYKCGSAVDQLERGATGPCGWSVVVRRFYEANQTADQYYK